MRKLQGIGKSIHPSIQITVDYPTNNPNGRMPVLDTEHWLEKVEKNNGEKKVQVVHSHYSKPMANTQVIHKNSAISEKSKHNILVADLVRIMRNISTICKKEERKKRIQFFMNKMQNSGYDSE